MLLVLLVEFIDIIDLAIKFLVIGLELRSIHIIPRVVPDCLICHLNHLFYLLARILHLDFECLALTIS